MTASEIARATSSTRARARSARRSNPTPRGSSAILLADLAEVLLQPVEQLLLVELPDHVAPDRLTFLLEVGDHRRRRRHELDAGLLHGLLGALVVLADHLLQVGSHGERGVAD